MKNLRFPIYLITLLFLLNACDQKPIIDTASEASQHTLEKNQQIADFLPLDDQQDFIEARKGLIASEERILITKASGETVWDTDAYTFMEGDAPKTVNPSLWRQEKLNNIHGLFEVSEGIYQLRGYDLSNMTLIKGDTGWIVVDPLTVEETARHAFNFAMQHLEKLPIKAIIYTHSHIDHFGGVQGIVSDEDIAKNNIRIIAPEGFMEEATSENVIVGLAMGRRASFMYGRTLEKSALGNIGTGLGKSPPFATFSLIAPTELIDHTGQTLEIDGVKFVFQYTPDAEAPAEMVFYLPEKKALCVAELGLRSMHNLYTLRGAKVRDALKWSGYLQEAKLIFPETEVYFGSHHWPMWGNKNIHEFLSKQADGYKFIHDQSVRLINNGYTPNEIAAELELPESLAKTFANRGYYGTLKHNAKAIYQNYMGWYDANPANLDPLPPEDSAKRYVKLMGGSENILPAAQQAFDEGEYQWTAELLNKLVFAQPENKQARALLAQTYQQLGFQAEAGPWRNVYLSGAQELLHGKSEKSLEPILMKNVLQKTPINYFLDALAVNLNPKRAEGVELKINLSFEDVNEHYYVTIENSVFHYRKVQAPLKEAEATVYLSREFFLNMLVLRESPVATLRNSNLKIDGEKLKVLRLLSLLDPPESNFNIVTP